MISVESVYQGKSQMIADTPKFEERLKGSEASELSSSETSVYSEAGPLQTQSSTNDTEC